MELKKIKNKYLIFVSYIDRKLKAYKITLY